MTYKLISQLFALNTNVTTQNQAGMDMSPGMKTFYDTQLLENSRRDLRFNQFGSKQPLPAGNGNSIEWRKFNTFAPALTPLEEGVNPDGKHFGMTKIEAECTQHGDFTAISDKLELQLVDPVIMEATKEMGAAGNLTADILTRNVVHGGLNVMYAPQISGGTETEITSRHALNKNCLLTPDLVNRIVTKLKKAKAPRIGGCYVMMIHPSQTYDLMRSDDWVDYHKYEATEQIFNGEIGKLFGMRFVENDNIKVMCGADLASNSRNLAVNNSGGYTNATSVAFDGGTVAADALIGRYVIINGAKTKVTDNTGSTLTLETGVTCADNAVIYPGEGGAEGLAVYLSVAFGEDAYGIIDPEGAGMEMIIHGKDSGGTSNPLNLYSTIGYKFMHGAKILYPERLVRVETCSFYSDRDKEND